MITCTVVLVTAAVILGFVLKNQVRENPDKNTVNVAIGQWGTTQNESQNYWNPDNHAVAKGMGGYYFIQTTDGISKIRGYLRLCVLRNIGHVSGMQSRLHLSYRACLPWLLCHLPE